MIKTILSTNKYHSVDLTHKKELSGSNIYELLLILSNKMPSILYVNSYSYMTNVEIMHKLIIQKIIPYICVSIDTQYDTLRMLIDDINRHHLENNVFIVVPIGMLDLNSFRKLYNHNLSIIICKYNYKLQHVLCPNSTYANICKNIDDLYDEIVTIKNDSFKNILFTPIASQMLDVCINQ